MYFRYDPPIFDRFPTTIGGIALVRGVDNDRAIPELDAAYTDEQQRTIGRLGDTALSELPSLSAWRGVFRSFGVDPTQVRSAAEALLRRLTKKGDIPHINPLVDLGNLISIRYALPVAMVDTRGIENGLTVRFADGSERFTILNMADGRPTDESPVPGEVIFSDENKSVVARRWCWRQSEGSAARPDTTDLLVTIEGHHPDVRQDVGQALNELIGLLQTYMGIDSSRIQSAILDRDHPAISS